ncbi:hypothetical protein ACS0TY_005611 [Phlomoides rotata]
MLKKNNTRGGGSDPPKQEAKKEVEEEEEDGNMFLTGKNPFFDVVLTNSNLKPYYNMFPPASITSILPLATVPAVLRYGGKNWDSSYMGNARKNIRAGWKEFVDDNHLKVGDACIFELMENTGTRLRFRVIIMRNKELPPKWQTRSNDKSVIEVIEID